MPRLPQVDQEPVAPVPAVTDLEREHAEEAETERLYAQIRERAKPLAVARARNEDIPTTAQLRSYLAMLASNRGRTFAITLKALPEDTQHDITGGTYRGPLAQEFRSWCESGKGHAGRVQPEPHLAPRFRRDGPCARGDPRRAGPR